MAAWLAQPAHSSVVTFSPSRSEQMYAAIARLLTALTIWPCRGASPSAIADGFRIPSHGSQGCKGQSVSDAGYTGELALL